MTDAPEITAREDDVTEKPMAKLPASDDAVAGTTDADATEPETTDPVTSDTGASATGASATGASDTGTSDTGTTDPDTGDVPATEPRSAFPLTKRLVKGYAPASVDAFLARARAAFEGDDDPAITAEAVRTVAFPLVKQGYSIAAVDAALGRVEDAFAVKEREAAIRRTGAGAWVESARENAQVILGRLSRPRGKRFARAGWLHFGYRIDEVDIVADKLRGYFERGAAVSADQVRGVAFRMQRRGYREEQVDAVLDGVIDVMLAVR